MIKLHPASHQIEASFILALFTVFAATALLAVLIGAKQYRLTAGVMDANYGTRTTASYLTEKVRASDASGAIRAADFLGVPALAIQTSEGGTVYTTYIYYYDNYLRELFVADSSVYSLESGQEIIELSDFTVRQLREDLICATYTGTDGTTRFVCLPIHTSGGKGDV